jgi:N-acetylneuraminic acid mutarotase
LRTANQARTLTFAERVNYQRAIEDIYWRHRIWPKERPDPKPSLDAVMSPAQLENKVEDYQRNSQALENYWQRPITPDQLQAEMKRMASHTKQPEMLRELFEALANDPFVIAECLARPALSERMVSQFDEMNPNPDSEPEQDGEAWLQSQSAGGKNDTATDPSSTGYSLPDLPDTASTCNENTWSSLINLPARRANHTAVWTGSEMIVFGGLNYEKSVGSGDRYNPATDSWSKVRLTNAPVARNNHTAVWTGTEMIVWGGYHQIGTGAVYLNSGGRYNPANNTWTPTSTSNAPTARGYHTSVWTGTRMLVWGGFDATGLPNTGGRYDPVTNSWHAMTTANAPGGRYQHSVVWTGTAMIIWGGRNCVDCYLNSGAKYNPASDTWTRASPTNAPGARFDHSAVWTGNEMIIWGGWNNSVLSDGAKYNPASNAWTTLSAINPPEGRSGHSAAWTGYEMIVSGGIGETGGLNSGSRYNPASNTWTPISRAREQFRFDTHTTIWTGSEMIVFGGGYDETLNTGERYNPTADTWTPLRTTNTPEGRYMHTAVWTGSEMIVWGGEVNSTLATNSGGRYDPALDTWTPTSQVSAPQGREDHTAVWTGTEMIVWGGWYSDGLSIHILNSGGRYNPATDNWTRTTLINAPSRRRSHTAVWTGTEMIVWGGDTPGNTGGRYNPATNSWVATSTTNAPSPRSSHTAVWTSSEMIVFGGGLPATNTGGRYNPFTNSWVTISTNTLPRSAHTAVWTGSRMIVWGGYNGITHVNTGARYNPSTNTWTATSLVNAPTGRAAHAAIWTGKEMIVWGGYNYRQDRFFNTGGRYNPRTDSWTRTATVNAPEACEFPTAVWTGSRIIVWGGLSAFYDPFGHHYTYLLGTGGRYCAGPE